MMLCDRIYVNIVISVKQQHQSETPRDVGCLSVRERLESDVKSSAGQGLKVIGECVQHTIAAYLQYLNVAILAVLKCVTP